MKSKPPTDLPQTGIVIPLDGAYKPQKRHPKSRDSASVNVCNANPIAPRPPEQPALPLKEETHMNHSRMIIPQYIVDVN